LINGEFPEAGRPHRYEQLFVRLAGDGRFEVRCIPFALCDIALGLIGGTAPRGDRKYIIREVVKPSGRYVFRVGSPASIL
jgi:hypothetical protein